MQMDHLHRKQPHQISDELRVHLIAYNLIRQTMLATVAETELQPWQIRCEGSMRTLTGVLPVICQLANAEIADCMSFVAGLSASHLVSHRPGRCEPRPPKRRQNGYKLIQKPQQRHKPGDLRNVRLRLMPIKPATFSSPRPIALANYSS